MTVPDRIDYGSDGELDDVVINNCMAHLERMDASRWYLGLYGGDGRIVQIDIASRTGRAEVTGLVKYSEGVGVIEHENVVSPVDQARGIALRLLAACEVASVDLAAVDRHLARAIREDPALFWMRGEETPPEEWRNTIGEAT